MSLLDFLTIDLMQLECNPLLPNITYINMVIDIFQYISIYLFRLRRTVVRSNQTQSCLSKYKNNTHLNDLLK